MLSQMAKNQINSFIRLESDPDLTPVVVIGVHGRDTAPENYLLNNYLINYLKVISKKILTCTSSPFQTGECLASLGSHGKRREREGQSSTGIDL